MRNKELLKEILAIPNLKEMLKDPELIKEMNADLEPKKVVKEFDPPTGHNDCLDYVRIPEVRHVCNCNYPDDPHIGGYPRW